MPQSSPVPAAPARRFPPLLSARIERSGSLPKLDPVYDDGDYDPRSLGERINATYAELDAMWPEVTHG